ncbi:MAG: type III secretion system export apparatus subunit SctT [Candidatus Adiutrix sp.]|jgi:type III secretion protein T|nr:type III secretion system export apparatus subunit SctT [Candidatus Adiutrix sp.]
MAESSPLVQALVGSGLLILLAMARMGTFFAYSLIFGSSVMPAQMRNSLMLVLALLALPLAAEEAAPPPVFDLAFLGLLGKEIFLGYLLAYAFNILFWIAEGVGLLIDHQRGASQASQADPLSENETSPLGSLLFQGAVMIFFGSGALLGLIGFFLESYVTWPIFSFWPDFGPRGIESVCAQFAFLMISLVTLAGPALIACLLTDFGMGLINRFAPQLNVFFLAMPIKSAFALCVLIAYAAGLLSAFSGRLADLDFFWFSLIQAVT